jgi:hypothetical protein
MSYYYPYSSYASYLDARYGYPYYSRYYDYPYYSRYYDYPYYSRYYSPYYYDPVTYTTTEYVGAYATPVRKTVTVDTPAPSRAVLPYDPYYDSAYWRYRYLDSPYYSPYRYSSRYYSPYWRSYYW